LRGRGAATPVQYVFIVIAGTQGGDHVSEYRAGHRYFPRSGQDAAAASREAAFLPEVSELRETIGPGKRAGDQLKRFAQMQQELDAVRRMLRR
jgi:hypothetical protein